MPLSVGAIRVAIGIVPVSFLSGFVMPLLVDRWSSGDAGLAGKAYAVNVLGSILGPIFASFVLMPRMSEAWSIIVLSLPLFAIGLIIAANMARQPEKVGLARHPRATMSVVIVASLFLLLVTQGFEEKFPQAIVLRDSTATVIGIGDGMKSQLLINGYGTTGLTPDTKMMAHLPLAFLQHRPKDALVICFGMGTTYRSLLSWGINATAVELVPSVPLLFENFHPDGSEVLNSPRGKIVIDDGRRFLERSHQQYDVITIDPPPPTEAAGSSLLYSVEFCRSLRDRLRPGGILQHWFPGGDAQAAIARTIKATFTYVRVFPAIESAGLHFIASMSPIAEPDASTLSGRMPPRAREDFVEYGPAANAEDEFNLILKGEYPIDAVIMAAPYFPIIEDDRPVNEYYFLRRTFNVFWIIGGSMGDEEEDGL
jgi:predicted membrane-bound spermidine synthase